MYANEVYDCEHPLFVTLSVQPRDQEPVAKSFSVNPAAAAANYAPAGAAVKRCGQGFLACEKSGELRCARCKDIWYCSAECQKQDWKRHKAACAK